MIEQPLIEQKVGLILSGGGARAAYQVGVLKAIYKILPKKQGNPFDIISGTSAGAINGVALASYAEHYRIGIRHLERIWNQFSCDQIYRTDFRGGSSNLLKFARSMLLGGAFRNDPVSFLDNTPLYELLSDAIKFHQIQPAIDNGALHAVAVNCSGINSGLSMSFFQGHYSLTNWQHLRRAGKRMKINAEHLMASSAIPMVFPAVKLQHQYYADGAVRQLSPISPALHLGANKIMVIGVSGSTHQPTYTAVDEDYPSPGKIMGHMLNAAFLDSMDADLERLRRINRLLEQSCEPEVNQQTTDLRKIDLLEINPSQSIDKIASEHAEQLPKILRLALGYNDNRSTRPGGLLSYLLFSSEFCKTLIDLGYHDAMDRCDEITDFFGIESKIADAADQKTPTSKPLINKITQ